MVARLCLGKRLDGQSGLWITRPGIDAVNPSPDVPESFIIDTRWAGKDIERIVAAGIVTGHTWASGAVNSDQIPHGLGYAPIMSAAEFIPANNELRWDNWRKSDGTGGASPSYYTDWRIIARDTAFWTAVGIAPGSSQSPPQGSHPANFAWIMWRPPL